MNVLAYSFVILFVSLNVKLIVTVTMKLKMIVEGFDDKYSNKTLFCRICECVNVCRNTHEKKIEQESKHTKKSKT